MDDEALSWFVDNQVTKALLARARRRRGRRASAASTREVRVELDPARLLALERDRGRHLAPAAPGAAGGLGRPHRPRRRRAVGAHASPRCSRPTSWRALRDPARPTAAACASTRSPRVTDTVAEQRSAALLERQAGGRLRDRAHRAAPARSRSPPACAPRSTKLQGAAPGHQRHRGLQLRRPGGQENYDGSMTLLYEGAALAVLVVLAVPARLARDAGRRRWRCRCR